MGRAAGKRRARWHRLAPEAAAYDRPMRTLRRFASTGIHASSAFLPGNRPTPVLSRRKIAATHAHIAFAAAHRDPDDYTEKQVRLFDKTVTFFNWEALHYLYDEIFVESCYAFDTKSARPRIIDAGGNIGMATLWFSMAFPNSRITTIEPDPTTFRVLQKNVSDNGLANVELVQAALGAAPGSIEFIVDETRPGALTQSVDRSRNEGRPIRVPMVRLSDLLDGPIDLLKIDVEGAEFDVMRDMVATGALQHVRAISMEYHHNIGATQEPLSEMLSLLEAQGFAYRVGAPMTGEPLSRGTAGSFQDIAVLAARAA